MNILYCLFLSVLLNGSPVYTKETYSLAKIYSVMQSKDIHKACYTLEASYKYNVDFMLLTHLINSESGYISTKHSVDHVTGLAGINSKFWRIPNGTIKEQIFAGAYVLRKYLDKNNNNYIEALYGYKGRSEVGRQQALRVYRKYKGI